MKLTHRKPRPIDRTEAGWRDMNLVVIATEGKTEAKYFRMIKERFRRRGVQVEMIPTENNKSAPEYVLERISGFYETFALDEHDQLWMVFDFDRWGEEKLEIVVREAKQKGFSWAVSNPSFEIWLVLHFETLHWADMEQLPSRMLKKKLEEKLKTHLGSYHHGHLNTSKFTANNIGNAVQQAASRDAGNQDRWPRAIGTHVYKIIRNIARIDDNHTLKSIS
ncbi:MAG: RloB family protein [Candidatus Sumerlaeota bacterium]|nr:RloB family protein [Candidatus Sumerlaeota bacterium]